MTLESILKDSISERRSLERLLIMKELDRPVRRLVKKKMKYLSKLAAATVAELTALGFTSAEISNIVSSVVVKDSTELGF